ncbi:MAG: hypothetical protein FWD75_06940 [Propionibacteriaceae bacterium]|nr:hypothetical protein [Propionibacteriaceae bacterium]
MMRVWEGDGSQQHLLAIFDSSPASGLFSVEDAERLNVDVVWMADQAPRARDDRDGPRDPADLLGDYLQDHEVDAGQVTCLGLSPHASAAALACGLHVGAAHVVCLGLASSAWSDIMAQRSPHTQILVLAAPKDSAPDTNVGWLAAEQHLLPRCSIIEWDTPRASDFSSMARMSKAYWMALLTLFACGTSFDMPGRAVVGASPSAARAESSAQWTSAKGVFALSKAWFAGGKIYLDGVAFFRGRPLPDYSSISRELIVESEAERRVFPLGSIQRDSFSDQYARGVRIDYRAAGFAEPGRAGLRVADLPSGRHFMSVRVSEYGRVGEYPLTFPRGWRMGHCWGDKAFTIRADLLGHAVLDIVDIPLSEPGKPFLFHLDEVNVDGTRMHIRGRFAVEGLPMRTYSDGEFYLWLNSPASGQFTAIRLGALRVGASGGQFGGADYSTSYFADMRHEGADLSGLKPGDFAWRIVLVSNRSAVAVGVGRLIVGEDSSITMQVRG